MPVPDVWSGGVVVEYIRFHFCSRELLAESFRFISLLEGLVEQLFFMSYCAYYQGIVSLFLH